ncbi:aldose epimerase family protein [Streptococcus hyovaginalis]|uniref:aldose epimerase family protein n=1 Tax=Streptococcus hyovaginalis TaxID=149015 RepID=UPI0014791ECF|nr:aldose epimerase family protein [Streptococcus hyovaginalis]
MTIYETSLQTSQGEISVLTLQNNKGTRATVTNLGASLLELWVSDSSGHYHDVVLGFNDIEAYLTNTDTYFGATVGRNANRTEKGQITLNGQVYQLPQNEGKKNLHSGPDGYQLRIWQVEQIDDHNNRLIFKLHSPDGDQGFPGNLDMTATYTLSEDDQLTVSYQGKADQDTIFNPTNHTYFNLNGHNTGLIEDHQLQINADYMVPINEDAIPLGEKRAVADSPFDFRQIKTIGQDIHSQDYQIQVANGYDHTWLKKDTTTDVPIVTLIGNRTGITLTLSSNLPGVQVYTGNFIKDQKGKEKTLYQARTGVALETQYVPNAINMTIFEKPILKKDQTKTYTTHFRFSTL